MMSIDETKYNDQDEEIMTATNQTTTKIGNKLRSPETFTLPWNTEKSKNERSLEKMCS